MGGCLWSILLCSQAPLIRCCGAGLRIKHPVSCGATVLAAVRADQDDAHCGFPVHAHMLLTLSRLDPVPLGFPAASAPGQDTTVQLRGPRLRQKLQELGLEALRARFRQTLAAKVAATEAAVQVCAFLELMLLPVWAQFAARCKGAHRARRSPAHMRRRPHSSESPRVTVSSAGRCMMILGSK